MTEIEKQIREALAKATPGPWRVSSGDVVADDADRVVFCTEDIESPDADLTVLLRNNATALLDRLAAAEAEVERLRAALRWAHPAACSMLCPSTGVAGVPIPHLPECARAAAALAKEDERA